MAFGKKDNSEQKEPAAEAEAESAEPMDGAPEAAPAPEAMAPAEVTAEAAPAAAPDSVDALLSVFQTTQAEAEDNTVLLEAAGDISIVDLLDELQTIAAALGIDTSGVMDFEEDELLAA